MNATNSVTASSSSSKDLVYNTEETPAVALSADAYNGDPNFVADDDIDTHTAGLYRKVSNLMSRMFINPCTGISITTDSDDDYDDVDGEGRNRRVLIMEGLSPPTYHESNHVSSDYSCGGDKKENGVPLVSPVEKSHNKRTVGVVPSFQEEGNDIESPLSDNVSSVNGRRTLRPRALMCGADLTCHFAEIFGTGVIVSKKKKREVEGYVRRVLGLPSQANVDVQTMIRGGDGKSSSFVEKDLSQREVQELRMREKCIRQFEEHRSGKYRYKGSLSKIRDDRPSTPTEFKQQPHTDSQYHASITPIQEDGITFQESPVGVADLDVVDDISFCSFDIFNEEKVDRIIQDALISIVTANWYTPHDPNSSVSLSAGRCVELWIERGLKLDTETIEPKLVWKLARVDNSHYDDFMSHSPHSGSIQLMDINRVLDSPSLIDTKKYPLANCRSSFLVLTRSGESHLFEMRDESQKVKEVKKLKVAIANLISKLASGEDAAIFFNEMPTKSLAKTSFSEEEVWSPKQKNLNNGKLTSISRPFDETRNIQSCIPDLQMASSLKSEESFPS